MTTCKHCGCADEMACQGGCFWIRPGVCSKCYWNRLTKAHRREIKLLGSMGATLKERAVCALGTKLSTSRIAGLVTRRLADKRIVSRHRTQRTHYWLTNDGACLYDLYKNNTLRLGA